VCLGFGHYYVGFSSGIYNYVITLTRLFFLWMQAKERRGKSLSKEKQKAETSAPVVNQ
jgi:hypothetical protein